MEVENENKVTSDRSF